ncbi:hypothetical protein MRX96_012864 [Rhipicephalus microplus]
MTSSRARKVRMRGEKRKSRGARAVRLVHELFHLPSHLLGSHLNRFRSSGSGVVTHRACPRRRAFPLSRVTVQAPPNNDACVAGVPDEQHRQ